MKNSIELLEVLTSLDLIIFALVLLITFASIVWGNMIKKKDGPNSFLDHLIMGRQLTLPLFIATLVATWYGGIFGVTENAFKYGLVNFLTMGIFWYLTYLIFTFFMVKKIKQHNAVTLPEMVGQMFGPKASKLAAVFNFFNVVPIVYTISLGIIIQSLTGLGPLISTTIGVSIVCCYSLFGGFRAVVFSDLIQFFVMCLAVFLVIFFSYSEFGGIEFLKSRLPSDHMSLFGSAGILTTLVWGLIALSTLVDPNFYQRCFAADSSKTAKNGILISTVIWILFDLCTTFGAMYARSVIPEATADKAYLFYSLQILPDGLRGFFLAGIFATILSTMDSYLFLAGTTLTYDLFPKWAKKSIRKHHFGIFFVGLLSILMASLFEGNIKKVWKVMGSYSSACMLLPIFIGHIFPGKISDRQFIYSSILGMIGTTYARLSGPQWAGVEIDELYIGSMATALGLLLFSYKPGKNKFSKE